MLDWLANGSPKRAVLLPCNDDGLELVLRHRAELEELGNVPIEANAKVLAAMLDKQKTYELALASASPRLHKGAPRTAPTSTKRSRRSASPARSSPPSCCRTAVTWTRGDSP